MTAAQQKIVQYLEEAHAMEQALERVLESQVAMTPRGSYRTGLEKHLVETREHAQKVGGRLDEIGHGGNPLLAVVGIAETIIGQAIALSKTPLDLLRGAGGAEKVLKNAKDTCATEALEIATYTTLEHLATAVGDERTARMVSGILKQEQRMLERVTGELASLTEAMIRAEIKGLEGYDITTTGAGEAVKTAAKAAKSTAKKTSAKTKRTAVKASSSAKSTAKDTAKAAKGTAREARKVPGVAQVEGELKGAVADASDLAITGYDTLTAEEISSKLPGVSQIELAKIDAYERKNQDRSTITRRIQTLRGQEPWPGYDELTAAEVQSRITGGDDELAASTLSYERAHKARAGVMSTAEKATTTV